MDTVVSGIVGAVFGYLLPYLIGFTRFLWDSKLCRQSDYITGHWYGYHFTRRHKQQLLRKTHWNIRRNWRNKLEVKMTEHSNNASTYIGELSFRRNYLLVSAKRMMYGGRVELAQWRFYDSIPSSPKYNILHGYFMGVDLDDKAYTTRQVISQEPLDDKEATDLLTTQGEPWE